jgi:hypothetical protein
MLPSAWERKIRSGNETRGEGHWHLLGESPCESRRRLSCVQFELSKTELVLYSNGHQFVDSHKNLFSGFVGGRWSFLLMIATPNLMIASSGFECKHCRQFCHPPSLPQEACTSAIDPASVRPCHAAVKVTQQQAHAPADVGSRSGPVAKNI